MIVVDANVAVKWLVPEPGETEARQLLEDGRRLVAPDLIEIEVPGALLRKHREGELTEARVRAAHELWKQILENGVLNLVPLAEVIELAVDIAFQAKHPLADCLYVAASKQSGCGLVTADRTLYKRCKSVYDNIQRLIPGGD